MMTGFEAKDEERSKLVAAKLSADLEAARATLMMERHDLERERMWAERRISDERSRLEHV